MRPLQRPTWDGLDDFEAIVDGKQKPQDVELLTAVRGRVVSGTLRYRACAPHLEDFRCDPVSSTEKAALHRCYQTKTAARDALLARVEALNEERIQCPLCGVDTASSWDHYLPKEDFPTLALCVFNLVRVCLRCNNKRGQRWKNTYGRTTMHMYYDWIPVERRLLEADVYLRGHDPVVRYRLEARVESPGFEGCFARHCKSLELLPRYNAIGTARLVDVMDGLSRSHDPEAVRRVLEHRAEVRARRHGANHWEAVLYRGAADSPTFSQYVASRGARQ